MTAVDESALATGLGAVIDETDFWGVVQVEHRVSFEEAKTVFSDEEALLKEDPDHSRDEERFMLLGMSSTLRTLVVCHCYRSQDDVIRNISARKATRSERVEYERRLSP